MSIKNTELAEKLSASAMESCIQHGYNPFDELIQIAQHKEKVIVKGHEHLIHTASIDQRIRIASEIGNYVAPKTKPGDAAGKKDTEFHIHLMQFSGNMPQVSGNKIKKAEKALPPINPSVNLRLTSVS